MRAEFLSIWLPLNFLTVSRRPFIPNTDSVRLRDLQLYIDLGVSMNSNSKVLLFPFIYYIQFLFGLTEIV